MGLAAARKAATITTVILALTKEWKHFAFRWSDLTQQGYGDDLTHFIGERPLPSAPDPANASQRAALSKNEVRR